LKKDVANTEPKVDLKMYLNHNDGDLIILCGRGAYNTHHSGNKVFYKVVDGYIDEYLKLSKNEKQEFTKKFVQDSKICGRHSFGLINEEWKQLNFDDDDDMKKIHTKHSQRFREAG